jgi:hypothetical protein
MNRQMVFSFILACIVIAGALFLFNKSLLREPTQSLKASSSLESPRPEQPLSPQNAHSVVPPEDIPEQGKVVKCVLDEKTIYSDTPCSAGAKIQKVELHDTAGVVSPPKAVLAEITAQRHAAESAYDQHMQKQVSAAVQSPKIDCDVLAKQIEWFNAMARQPQSGQMQDWIKQERSKVQGQQFVLHC